MKSCLPNSFENKVYPREKETQIQVQNFSIISCGLKVQF